MNHPESPRKSKEHTSSSEPPIWGPLLVTAALKPHSLEKDTPQGALGCPSILSGESTCPGFCIRGPDANTCSQFSGRVSQPLALPASPAFTSSASPPHPLLDSSIPGLLPAVPSSHSVTFFQSSHYSMLTGSTYIPASPTSRSAQASPRKGAVLHLTPGCSYHLPAKQTHPMELIYRSS